MHCDLIKSRHHGLDILAATRNIRHFALYASTNNIRRYGVRSETRVANRTIGSLPCTQVLTIRAKIDTSTIQWGFKQAIDRFGECS